MLSVYTGNATLMTNRRPRRASIRATPPTRASIAAATQVGATRAQVVWVSFLGAMTLVGGLLLLVDGRPVPRIDGMSLSPLASATTIGLASAQDPVTQTRASLAKDQWQAIVIHHTGSRVGSPPSITQQHQDHGLQGLGHHFVIGNGNGMDDGQVHIGYRWLDQLPGAHASGTHADWYNLHAVSICLVGDGNRQTFTPAQLRQLGALVESLKRQLGLASDRVLLHSDIAGVSDPGRFFPAAFLARSR